MGRIYSNTNKIKFTDISDKYQVPKVYKGRLGAIHSSIIVYVASHFRDSKKYKQQVVDVLNLATYYILVDESPDTSWRPDNPLVNVPEVDPDLVEAALQDMFLTVDAILWDVKPVEVDAEIVDDLPTPILTGVEVIEPVKVTPTKQKVEKSVPTASETVPCPTPKQDLYIQPPVVPQFDYARPWIKGIDGADSLVIYTTLPDIPTKQNEISVTTDVSKLTSRELMQLYPNCTIHTRASVMYEPLEGVELHPQLGLILPIEGFTREEVIDNIIRYPHIFKLARELDGKHYSFYSHIEVDGELLGTLDIWDTLPEAYVLPRQAEFVKEYVVRRYLLERDVKHIKHRYPIYGTLDPFLTLFMRPDDYIQLGYKDPIAIAKECVQSRVSYKQSRNPVLRRLKYV